jgi:SAM-dependent methyltransferase
MQPSARRSPDHRVRLYQAQRYQSVDQAWVNRREQRIVAKLLAQCRLAGGSLLDAPCGYGRFTPLFARLGMTVTGIDVNPHMVHLARENHGSYGQGRWLCASILALPFADDTFDGVLCVRLLHHHFSVAERQRLFAELARVSRRIVLISFYRRAPLHVLSRYWRGTLHRRAMLRLPHIQTLAQESGLRMQHLHSVLRFGHAQTFVVLTKATRPAS